MTMEQVSSYQPHETAATHQPPIMAPQPVVNVLSSRGVEYVFMTITLFGGALGLAFGLLALVNGAILLPVLAVPAALLIVSVPIFARLFLRLKEAELRDPQLRLDPSKRRSTQFIQIVSFLVCFITLIGFVALLFAKVGGEYNGSLSAMILDPIIILAIAGGILGYYWHDEHRTF
jgi:hypothetical protein